MESPIREFPVRRDAVASYLKTSMCLALFFGGVWIFGLGLPAAVLYWFFGEDLSRRQSSALSYRLEGGLLRADSGVYFLKRKAIPLERVTDITLAQGPVQRRYGIWSLHVQTAGAGAHNVAEAVLFGLEEPERVRDELLRARDAAVLRARVS